MRASPREPSAAATSRPLPGRRPGWRWLPLAGLALAIAAAYGLGLDRHLTLAALAANREALAELVAGNLGLALLAFIAVYVAATALSLPVAALLSIAGGLLFGWAMGAAAAVLAASLGAILVFAIVRTSLGHAIAHRAGGLAARLSAEFEKDAFSYLLFLRLVPAFPFFAVNAAAGLTGIALRTFILATLIGIIPGALAYAYLGSGLDALLARRSADYRACLERRPAEGCSLAIGPSDLVTPEIVIGLAALGAVALIPMLLRRWRARSG